ncbi:cytochrome b561 domain-containing protein At4g18260-like [Salvia miltiorrhiza]|uniref:cytochrome b561 domain-containing protein At4g18260-like n=1 Tax=Salvia miltiorrhiza TaxID=226208 RepID=UPI0025ACC026|nr:cytochrome b561 domain-containing protein At4g18260-like [Salvia miltiorrhiza]
MSPLRILCAAIALLLLAHFPESSSYKQQDSSSRGFDEHHESSQKVFDILVHGILLWASMGFLIPLGILVMRISSCRSDFQPSRHKTVFYVHAVLQVLSVLLVTAGAILSIRNFENAFNNTHQRIGLALYAAIYMQLILGFKRPKRGTRARSAWYFLHWLLGTITCLVGILNIYTGLQAYHKRTSTNTATYTIIFTAQLSFMIIVYLFQDKWDYILRQGMPPGIVGSDPNNPLTSSQQVEDQIRDLLNEPCRKSNALGTHFSRTNVLNKLFQLT